MHLTRRAFLAAVGLALFARPAHAMPRLLVCDGNSLTDNYGGYVDMLTRSESFPIVNAAMTGQTILSCIERAPYFVDRFAPCDLFIWEGTNDLRKRQDPDKTHDAIRLYCLARQRAGLRVTVATVLPQLYDTPNFEAMRLTLNETIRAQWRGYAHALCDIGAVPIIGAVENCNDIKWYKDKIHLTIAGHGLVAECVRATYGLSHKYYLPLVGT